jgi:2-oxoglutarate ferredoxin oxidoreductase subunit beta
MVPTALTLAAGAGFIARSLANDAHQLGALIAEGMRAPGYAHIDVLQPCVSFGSYQGPELYEAYRARSYQLGPDYDPSDRAAAAAIVAQWGDRIPLGLLYRAAQPRPTYEQLLAERGVEPAVAGTTAHHPRRPEYRALVEGLA